MTAQNAAVPAAAGDALDLVGEVVRRLGAIEDEGERRAVLDSSIGLLDAEALLVRLKDEADRHWTIDPHVSLRLAEALMLAAQIAERPEHEALGIMAKGDAVRYLGRYPESIELFEEAAQRFRLLGDEVGWARTRIGWLVSMQRLGRGVEALEVADQAREVLAKNGQLFRAAGVDLNAAAVCRELGQLREALSRYERAQMAFESFGATAEVQAAVVRMNRANVLASLGELTDALALHQEARPVFARHGRIVSALQSDQNVAFVHVGRGYYTVALRLLTEALALAENAGLEPNAISVALNVADCYLGLNRCEEALSISMDALTRAEHIGARTESARARFQAAQALARLGDAAQALPLLEAAIQGFNDSGLAGYLAIGALQRARLYLAAGEAEAAFAAAELAHTLFAERGMAVRQAEAEIVRAQACLALGRLDEAAQLARSALALAEAREVLWLPHEAHHVLASAARSRGDLARALGHLHDAVAAIERAQSGLATELRTNFLDDKLLVYQDAIECALHLDRPAAAFDFLERAKSRALVDYLARNLDVRVRAHDSHSQALVDELTRLREEHNWFYNRLYGYSFRDGDGLPNPAETETLQHAIRERERGIARISERLALRQDAALEALVSPPFNQLIEPPRLPANTVLLEYYFHAGGGTVFVVSGDALAAVPLAVTPAKLHRLLALWQINLNAAVAAFAAGAPLEGLERNARNLLGELYRALVQPVDDHLANCERLVVVPYGLTHAIPFHALFDGSQFLLERLEVSVCPSSSLLRLCAGRPHRGAASALVVAHADGGRLPYVLEEARTVASLLLSETYLEAQATRAAVVEAAARHGVLHLAAHGVARPDNPAFAHLKLADGQLSTVDVFNLDLGGALVVLSACETGLSRVTGGDELIGLSRGFLHAGASTLVQSLWRVEDHATAQLMERFYLALRDGQPKGAALRAAQLALLAERPEHPYFWAAFQLVGDSGPL